MLKETDPASNKKASSVIETEILWPSPTIYVSRVTEEGHPSRKLLSTN